MFQISQPLGVVRRGLLPCFVLVGAQLSWAGPAGATGGTIRDGRDTKGALDIAAVGYSSRGDSVTHTVRLYSPFPSRALKEPQAVLAFTFDTNDDRRFDRLAVVVFANHALRAIVADTNGRILNVSRARRPDSRTIAITIPGRALGDQGGYRWTALTIYKDHGRCRRGCVDAAPNRVPVLFDFTPPSLDLGTPDPNNLLETTTDFAVHVEVADKGFSGVRAWTLEQRSAGQSTWSTVATGNAPADVDVPRTGSEGATYEFRLTAVDAKGNQSLTTRLVSVPIDDANPLLASSYTGGGWEAYVNPGYHLFLDTAHRAGGPDSTFTYSFTGAYVAWLSTGGCCPSARVSIDGGLPQTVAVGNSRRPFELGGLAEGRHTISIAPANAVPGYEIDGIVTR